LIPRRSQWRDDLVKIIGLDTNSMQLMIEECLELELEMFIPILENYQKRVSLIYELNNEKRLAIEKENFEILPKLRDLLKEEEEKAK
jgi:hypothetical protein